MAPQNNDPLSQINPENNQTPQNTPTPSATSTQKPTPTQSQPAPAQNTQNVQSTQTSQTTKSIVDALIAEANDETTTESNNISGGNLNQEQNTTNPTQQAKNTQTNPVSKMLILQYVGSLLLIFTIVFAAFITYIVLNPSQSAFFITIFNIDPADVAKVLKNIINITFGIVSFVLAIVWIIMLFRAIWTPKQYKRKRLFNWIFSAIIMIIMFSLISLWAFVFTKINATNFDNLKGSVLVYDNDLYINKITKPYSRVRDFANVIGPITLRYDISENAEQFEKSEAVEILNYQIDFDNAKCTGGKSILQGTRPTGDEGIICTFDEVRNYTITGKYTVKTRLGEIRDDVSIKIPPVEIKGLIDIERNKNSSGNEIITYDATKLKKAFGNPVWRYGVLDEKGNVTFNNPKEEAILTETVSNTPLPLCLTVFPSSLAYKKRLICDRKFIVQDSLPQNIEGNIKSVQDSANAMTYTFSLENINLKGKAILRTNWIIDNSNCPNKALQKCTYQFNSAGNHTIKAEVFMTGDETQVFEKKLLVITPLNITEHVKVRNIRGKLLNTQDTFNKQYKAYKITNVEIPSKIVLDARDVISENPGYELDKVNWTITKDGESEQLSGKRVEYLLDRSVRYTIEAEYLFKKSRPLGNPDDTMRSKDLVYIHIERGNLTPRLKVSYNSDYVPVTVIADASQSIAENSEIIEFQYDFGEGRPVASGDGIKKYTYSTPGKKTITLTMINAAGEKATTTKTLILKSTPKVVNFTSSLSPATVDNPVDFIAEGTNGQIDEYIWNFGDNTDIEMGYNITHTFAEAGNYNVTLTVRYSDGTEDSLSKVFTVVDSLE